jgi:hypothetical protein
LRANAIIGRRFDRSSRALVGLYRIHPSWSWPNMPWSYRSHLLPFDDGGKLNQLYENRAAVWDRGAKRSGTDVATDQGMGAGDQANVHALWLAHRPDLRLHPGPRLLGRRDPAAAGDPAGCPAGADLLRSKAWPIAYSMVRIRVEWPAQLFMPSLTVPHEKCRLQTN